MIYSGALTETLEFYSQVEVQSESGYKHTDEVYKFKVRAERLKNKMDFAVEDSELFHSSLLTFRMRYRREIKDTDIAVYEGERYRIISLDKYMQDNQLTIMIEKINE